MADVTNIQLGTCSITFNGTDLGHTIDGCEFSYEPNYTDIMVDKYGQTPVDKVLNGETVTVKCKLAEHINTNWQVAIPAGANAGAADARRTFGRNAGARLADSAAELVIHPLAQGDLSHDIVLHKAVVHSQVVLPHTNDEPTAIEVEFVALVDETKATGNWLGLIGDSTA